MSKSTHVATSAWHKPKCSACGESIVEMHDGLAACFIDANNRTHSPFLIHAGDCYRRVRTEHGQLHSLHVDVYRRTPMEAIIIAVRRRADSEAERLVWHSWINVVLGLPAGDESNVMPGGASATTVMDHVMTIDEARTITREVN